MKNTLLILCLLTSQHVSAQTKEDRVLMFDKNWKVASIKHAAYFIRVSQKSDSDYEWTYYNMYGPRIKQENYKDATGKIRNGKFTYYFDNGRIDSSGHYDSNRLDGNWYYRTYDGKLRERKHYKLDVLTQDSIYTVQEKKNYALKSGEKESEYPGGLAGWTSYLIKHLHYPERAVNAEIKGDVEISFLIDENGSVSEMDVNRSVEFSLDEESLRIIKESNTWIPASIDGRLVKSYKIQPIRFRLEIR